MKSTRSPLLTAIVLALTLAAGSSVAREDGAHAKPAAVAKSDKDEPSHTPAGTTFTRPAGWSETRQGAALVLSPPEPDLRIVLFDLEAADANAAVAHAWKQYKPDFARKLRLTTPAAPRSGWEERVNFEYETSPNEKLIITALAWRAGKQWLVGLFESSDATAEKRGAPTGLLVQSLRPKGYEMESFAGRKAHPLDEKRLAVLKDFVADGMKKLKVPGVGLAFYERGRILWSGGLGVRELGKPEPVDGDTLFIAASNTKAMSTLLIAQMVGDGKLRWDEPVVEAFPGFRLGDAATTKSVQIKHLICACTGMPRQDMEWLLTAKQQTPSSSVAMLGGMQPTSGFGEVFQYSNLMAAAAGFIGGAVAYPGQELGAAYDKAMQERIFAPLGMKRTTFDFAAAMRGNYARPHGLDVDGKAALGVMSLNYTVLPARPAGGVWTSPNDFIRYVAMELGDGVAMDGKRIAPAASVRERRAPQVVVGENIHYGMGLMMDNRWGTPIVRHGGDLAGYHSDMMWLPEHGVGAVILTNGDWGFALRGPLLRRMVEVMFDGKPEAQAQLDASVKQLEANRQKDRSEIELPPKADAVAKLAVGYRNESLGDIAISRAGMDVTLDVGEWKSKVATRRNEDGTITLFTVDPTLDGFPFVIGEKDGKRTLVLRDAQHEYVFVETDAAGQP